jgi:hypothetical protein
VTRTVRRPQYPARPLQFRTYPVGWVVYPLGSSTPGVVTGQSRNLCRVLVMTQDYEYPTADLRSATIMEISRHPHLLQLGRALVTDAGGTVTTRTTHARPSFEDVEKRR